jgi:hypothetical protein
VAGSLLRASSIVGACSKGCLVPRSTKTGSSCLPRAHHGVSFPREGFFELNFLGKAPIEAALFKDRRLPKCVEQDCYLVAELDLDGVLIWLGRRDGFRYDFQLGKCCQASM